MVLPMVFIYSAHIEPVSEDKRYLYLVLTVKWFRLVICILVGIIEVCQGYQDLHLRWLETYKQSY